MAIIIGGSARPRGGAGSLRERLSFQSRVPVDDGFGNVVSGDFVEQFRCWGRLMPLRGGGESVMAARLQGTQPVVATVRNSSLTSVVTTDWRIVDLRTGGVFAIGTVALREGRDFIDLDLISGTAP